MGSGYTVRFEVSLHTDPIRFEVLGHSNILSNELEAFLQTQGLQTKEKFPIGCFDELAGFLFGQPWLHGTALIDDSSH